MSGYKPLIIMIAIVCVAVVLLGGLLVIGDHLQDEKLLKLAELQNENLRLRIEAEKLGIEIEETRGDEE